MSICQRYLSKSFVFFSSLLIIFLLLLESNIGFKYIFNFTNYCFLGLKTEEISGNWRNFTLKNIYFDSLGFSIQAESIHITIDTDSLFKISTIFKDIETKNLIISLKENKSHPLNNSISADIAKKKFFFKNPIFFKRIHSDKILLKTNQGNMYLSNFFTSINLINNKIIFFSTYIHTISIESSYFNIHKLFKNNKLITKNSVSRISKIRGIFHCFSKISKFFIPLNVNLTLIKCQKLNILNYKNINLSNIELRAKLEKNILKIKKIKIHSRLLKIKSYGKFIFKNNYSTSFFLKNKILILNKKVNILFKGHINNQLQFKLKFNNLFKFNINGVLFLDVVDYPFYIQVNSDHLFFSITKNLILNLYNLNATLKGKINNYSLSLKNIFSINTMPLIFIDVKAKGNLKDIFLEKINFSSCVKKQLDSFILKKRIRQIDDNIKIHRYMSNIIGNINIFGKFNNDHYNLSIPSINLQGDVMKKRISVLGSLYYKDFNFLKTPGIECFLGRNKFYLKGSLGNKLNIQSSIHANNLDYFLPNLKGRVKAISNIYGFYFSPILSSRVAGNYLYWKNIYLKKINMRTTMHIKNKFSGYFSANAENIRISKFQINSINLKSYWTHKKQKFYFFLKSHKLHIKLILNSTFNYKTGNWHGFFKTINVSTSWGEWISKNTPTVNCYDVNKKIDYISSHIEKRKNIFSSFIRKAKIYLFNVFNKSSMSFKSKLFINAKLKWILGNSVPGGNIFLIGNNIKLKRIKNEITFNEKIDYLKTFIKFNKNNIKIKWIIKDFKNALEKDRLSGYLKIIDIYKTQKINGECTVFHFPFSFINFFMTNFKQVNGRFDSNIKFFGTLYQPKVSADVSFQNILIKSNDLLKYMTLFFHSFFKKVENLKINQEITMKKGNILFTLSAMCNKYHDIEWNLIFNSKKIIIEILPKIKLNFSSQLTLHHFLEKYDLIGYINFYFFYFKIDEKDFVI